MVTRESREDHEKKIFDVLKKLEDAEYRESEKESEFFLKKKQNGWEMKLDEPGIKPNKEKPTKAIVDLKYPENWK